MSENLNADGSITVDVVSDTICPWCYIGKKRLDQALALRPDVPVDVRWRPFQLDPTIPQGGVDRQKYLENKFGGPERAREIYGRIEAAAAQEGIEVHFDLIRRTPNTIDSHRVIRWAGSSGSQSELVERLFSRYFAEGADLEDPEELSAAAGAAGLDRTVVTQLLPTEADRDAVQQEIRQAQELGITGVPCFIFGNRFAVMGAQSPEILAQALDRAVTESAEAPPLTP